MLKLLTCRTEYVGVEDGEQKKVEFFEMSVKKEYLFDYVFDICWIRPVVNMLDG